jgi:ribonuclease P protein component
MEIMTLPRKNRIGKSEGMKDMFRIRPSVNTEYFTVRARKIPPPTEFRVSIVVPRTLFPSSVRRNAIRRQISEYIAQISSQIPKQHQFVISIKKDLTQDKGSIVTGLLEVLQKSAIVAKQ